ALHSQWQGLLASKSGFKRARNLPLTQRGRQGPYHRVWTTELAAVSMLKNALALHQRGQLEEAASLYHQIIAQNPQQADAMHLLGLIELQTGKPSAALDLIEQAIKIEPNDPAAFSNRGNALQVLQRFEDALASYDRALAIKSDFVDALYNRGVVL